MSMGMLEQILKTLVTEYDVIGVDICGMYPEENSLPVSAGRTGKYTER